MIFIFVFFVLTALLTEQNVLGAVKQLDDECLNKDGSRELDFTYTVGVQEFDELNKKVELTIVVHAEDKDKQIEPFDVYHRNYPHLGSSTIDVIPDDSENPEYYEIKANTKFTERRIEPILNFPINPWPFETYKIPMLLEFDKDVKLCYDTWDDGSTDVSVYKAGSFPENPHWQVDIIPHEITFVELKELIPEINPRFENSVFFQFDTIISHTDNYQKKIGAYFVLALAPIILMIGHLLYGRFKNINSHITLFAGVSILILTSIVAIAEMTPIDLTLLELISISSVITYATGFFIFLSRQKPRDSNIEQDNRGDKMKKKTPEYRDKVWKIFTPVFGIVMIALVSAFILASWNDSTSQTSKISDIASVLGVFLAVYIAVWVYKNEMDKKSEKENRRNYFEKMAVFALGTTRDKLALIKEHVNTAKEINQGIIDEWKTLKIPAERFEMIIMMSGDSLNHEISDKLDLIRGSLNNSLRDNTMGVRTQIEDVQKIILSLLTEKLDDVRTEVLEEYLNNINKLKEDDKLTEIEFDANKRRFHRMYDN